MSYKKIFFCMLMLFGLCFVWAAVGSSRPALAQASPAGTPSPGASPSPQPNNSPPPYPTASPVPTATPSPQPSASPTDNQSPQAPPDPVPENPVKQVYADGKVIVFVVANRHYAYRIGSTIPLTILVVSDKNVSLDFTDIQNGIYGLDGSDFETVSPADVKLLGEKEGKVIYEIDLKLRTFVTKSNLVFTADFLYATGKAADGKTPDWKRLTTPDFVITRSNTGDNGVKLDPGDESMRPYSSPWLTYPFLIGGMALILLWPTLSLIAWIQRDKPRRKIPPNELAWMTFDRVIAEGQQNGFTVKRYKQIAAALRRYFQIESLTPQEAAVKLRNHPDVETILYAIEKFDSVLYDTGTLSEADLRNLVSDLQVLVPQP